MTRRRKGRATDPALRRTARLEGLAAGSFRLAPAIVTVTVTVVAHELGAGVGDVQRAVAVATLVAGIAIGVDLWRLRHGPGAPVGRRVVLASMLLMSAALAGAALAGNAWTLTAALAAMGVPIGVNARFRYAAMAGFRGREGTFQGIAHRWNRTARIGGLIAVGAIVACPLLGWRWALAVAAAWFVVLAVLLWRLPAPAAAPAVGRQRPREQRLARQWRLASVKRHAGVMLLASAVMQLALAALEPALRDSGLGEHAATAAAVVLATAQLAVTGRVGRIAAGSDRSARRSALRAALALPLAAPLALATGMAPWALAALALALAWMAIVEVGFGGAAAATRVGLGRVGQLASLLGALAGYIGTSAGSFVASTAAAGHGRGLALALLAGALLTLALAAWTPRHATEEEVTTRSAEVRLALAPHNGRAVAVRVNDDPHPFVLYAGDLLQGRSRFDRRALAEPIELVRLGIWTDTPGWLWRLLVGVRGLMPRAGGLWPLDVVPFAAGSFGGTLRWAGPDAVVVHASCEDGELRLTLQLPADERDRKVRWRTLGGVGQDDPAPLPAAA